MKHRRNDQQPSLFDMPPESVNGPAGDGEVHEPSVEYRPGFKKVKHVGWAPEDWDVLPIWKVGRVVTGSTPSTSEDGYYGGPYPFVSPGDLGNHRDIASAEKTLTEEGFAKTRPVPKGSVLFTCISFGIGKTGLATRLLSTNQQINSVIPHDRRSGEYLYYYLDFMSGSIKRLAGLQATPILNKTDFSNVKVALPPLPEQRKIARILGAWDDALAQLDALSTAKEKRFKGLAQCLLTGEERLQKYADESWHMVKLGEVFRQRKENNREDLPLLSVTANLGIVRQDSLERRDTSADDKSQYLRVQPGDIAYNTMRMWQGVSALSKLEGIVSPAYTVCVAREGISPRFAAHLFKLPSVVHRFWRYSQGLVSDTLNLKFSNFKLVEVSIPRSVEEQKVITSILDAAKAEIDLLRRERDALAAQKKGLMQRLLTGEVRVTPDPEDYEHPTPAQERSPPVQKGG